MFYYIAIELVWSETSPRRNARRERERERERGEMWRECVWCDVVVVVVVVCVCVCVW